MVNAAFSAATNAEGVTTVVEASDWIDKSFTQLKSTSEADTQNALDTILLQIDSLTFSIAGFAPRESEGTENSSGSSESTQQSLAESLNSSKYHSPWWIGGGIR
jgi:hypothetical protein